MYIHKCKECGDSWEPKRYKDFSWCPYCDNLFCTKCHSESECLFQVEFDIPDGENLAFPEGFIYYMSKLLTVQTRTMYKIFTVLEEIKRNTA